MTDETAQPESSPEASAADKAIAARLARMHTLVGTIMQTMHILPQANRLAVLAAVSCFESEAAARAALETYLGELTSG